MKTKYEKPMAISVRGSTAEGDVINSCTDGSVAQGNLTPGADCTTGGSAAGKNCTVGGIAGGGECTEGKSVYGCYTGTAPHVDGCGVGGGFPSNR